MSLLSPLRPVPKWLQKNAVPSLNGYRKTRGPLPNEPTFHTQSASPATRQQPLETATWPLLVRKPQELISHNDCGSNPFLPFFWVSGVGGRAGSVLVQHLFGQPLDHLLSINMGSTAGPVRVLPHFPESFHSSRKLAVAGSSPNVNTSSPVSQTWMLNGAGQHSPSRVPRYESKSARRIFFLSDFSSINGATFGLAMKSLSWFSTRMATASLA